MHLNRLFAAAAVALLVCAAHPVRAQGISGDDIGPHGCIQSTPDAPAAAIIPALPNWLTMMQTRLGSMTLRWPSATPQRATLALRPVLGRMVAAVRRPRD
jgi:hypothetical protein